MLWLILRYIYRHWKHCRSFDFKTLGCGDHWLPEMAMLYVTCDKCHSTGGIPVRRIPATDMILAA